MAIRPRSDGIVWTESVSVRAIRQHGCLLLLLGCYAATVFPVAIALDRFPGDIRLASSAVIFILFFCAIGLLLSLLIAARRDRNQPGRAIAAWWRGWWGDRGPGVALSVAALPALMTTFLLGKLLIPDIQPFSWDERLAELDRELHGGDPWRLLYPFLGEPEITRGLSLLYSLWFIPMLAAWFVWAICDHPQRMRFLMSYATSWILLGTVAATLLSSAGPIFYADVTGKPGPFGDQVAYLRAVDAEAPLASMRIRDRLWASYTTGVMHGGSGISAMPSLHVAIMTLCAISSWYVSRRLGIVMTIYAAIIFLGSIHLGWHYAVDGYVAIIGAAAIWMAFGRFAPRPDPFRNRLRLATASSDAIDEAVTP